MGDKADIPLGSRDNMKISNVTQSFLLDRIPSPSVGHPHATLNINKKTGRMNACLDPHALFRVL